ncbi:MAG: hypothetical protein JJV98_18135 [Desulfosarcina sp.]|nr:hypothetical protein [Desulfobacterales bacterium]
MAYGIHIHVQCPHCGVSLMTPNPKIDQLDSIQLQVKIGNRIGHLYLSQVYGSYEKIFENVEDLPDAVVECSCPHCHRPFPVHHSCAICNAAVIELDLKVGGIIKVCSRNGCKHHSLEFEDSQDALDLFRSQDASGLF